MRLPISARQKFPPNSQLTDHGHATQCARQNSPQMLSLFQNFLATQAALHVLLPPDKNTLPTTLNCINMSKFSGAFGARLMSATDI